MTDWSTDLAGAARYARMVDPPGGDDPPSPADYMDPPERPMRCPYCAWRIEADDDTPDCPNCGERL